MAPTPWPALKLIAAPTGTAAVRGRAVHVGDDIPLGAGLSLGTEGDVRVAASVQKLHCRVELREGQARLWHYGKEFRTAINGMNRLEGELQHRDLIGLSGGTLFRYLERADVVAADAAMEKDIEARPDAEDRLLVWADWLQEQGDALGAHIGAARRGDAVDYEPWLDGWAAHFVSGRLQVDWQLGMARAVSVREVSMSFPSLVTGLERLLSLRVMRFVRELTVHLGTDRGFMPSRVAQLADLTGPATLQRLSIGAVPVSMALETEHALAELDSLKQRFPRLQVAPAEVFTDGVLEVLEANPDSGRKVGDVIEIGERVLLGLERMPLTVNGPPTYGSYLARRDGERFVFDLLMGQNFPMVVRGREVQRYPLCDGDVIKLGHVMTVRFKLRRP